MRAVSFFLFVFSLSAFAKPVPVRGEDPDPTAGVTAAGNAADDEDDEDDGDEEGAEGHPIVGDRASPSDGSVAATVQRRGTETAFGTVNGNVSITSDYIFRGQSQTGHEPAVQGGMDYDGPFGIYLGAWGSSIHQSETPAALELDVYGGYRYRFSRAASLSLGVQRFSFFTGGEGNSWEFPLKLAYHAFKVELSYAPHFGGQPPPAWYALAGWSDTLFWKTTLGFTAGYSMFAPELELMNYADFRLSLSREFLGVEWEAAYTFVNRMQFNGADESRVTLAVSKFF